MSSKSGAITALGCCGWLVLLVMVPFSLIWATNLPAAVLFAAAGGFALAWHRLAKRRYEKGGFR